MKILNEKLQILDKHLEKLWLYKWYMPYKEKQTERKYKRIQNPHYKLYGLRILVK